MASLCFLILNYNNYFNTEKCVKDILKLHVPDSEVVVIDNNSSDDSFNKLKKLKKYSDITLLLSEKNNGFASGNNIGINYVLKRNFDYFAILNNDLIIESNIFSPMVDYLKNNFDVAMVGPSIWENNNLKNIGNRINFTRIGYDNSIPLNGKKEVVDVDFLIGACMIVRSSAVLKVGLMPEVYFLNYEETEWCLKFKINGYNIKCLTQYKVNHIGGASISKFNGMQIYFLRRNLVLFERRNASMFYKVLFFSKLIPYSVLQCIHSGNLTPLKSYCDGFTENNKYDYLQ